MPVKVSNYLIEEIFYICSSAFLDIIRKIYNTNHFVWFLELFHLEEIRYVKL